MTIPRVPMEKAQALSPGQRQSLEHFYGALDTGDVALVDQALTSDWEDIPLAPGQAIGPEGIKPIFRMLISAFPDLFDRNQRSSRGGRPRRSPGDCCRHSSRRPVRGSCEREIRALRAP